MPGGERVTGRGGAGRVRRGGDGRGSRDGRDGAVGTGPVAFIRAATEGGRGGGRSSADFGGSFKAS
ncbi:hypothetical protein GCM10010385_66090 [Streptomyces geysiriensis]|nr:hypothetical protein GCM10010385_66090 [Streptomyces geysiriensis]